LNDNAGRLNPLRPDLSARLRTYLSLFFALTS